MLLFEQNNIKKEQINKFLQVPEFEVSNNKEYEIKIIQNSAVYAKEISGHLLRLYYLVA